MTDALMDRIKAHRSAPDVYDPPTFDQMADRIEELMNGVDGLGNAFAEMAVKREAAEAKLAKAVAGLRPFAKAAETWEPDDGDSALGARIEHPHHGLERHAEFTFGDLRYARTVLAELEG